VNADQFGHLSRTARAKAAGISRTQQQKLDALAKAGRGDLLAQIKAGNISVRNAMIEAGLEEEPTALGRLLRNWDKASEEEQRQFLRHVGAVFVGSQAA
jgi:hypothetical protein